MRIVVDSNILFSALIKNGGMRKLLFEIEEDLLTPDIVFVEIEKYKEELIEKSGLSWEELQTALHLILRRVSVIADDQLVAFQQEAWELVKEHSPEDVLFIACALAFEKSILWSDDKKLKRQNKIIVLNTQEIVEKFRL